MAEGSSCSHRAEGDFCAIACTAGYHSENGWSQTCVPNAYAQTPGSRCWPAGDKQLRATHRIVRVAAVPEQPQEQGLCERVPV